MTLATWDEFAASAPAFADAGLRLFNDSGMPDTPFLAYLATVRRSGAPRLHPVTPVIGAGGLFVFVGAQSPKRFDLLNDGRYAMHAAIGPSDEEFAITGTVRRVTDSARRAAAVQAARHPTHDEDVLVEFDIERCLWGIWENVGQPDTRPVYRMWDVNIHSDSTDSERRA
jgi:hypothetical protein